MIRPGTGNPHNSQWKLRLKNYDWSSDKDRAKLWDAKNGELAQVPAKVDNQKTRQVIVAQVGKIVRCTCGGYLRRDLDWPPPKIHVRREQKKTLTRPKILPKNTACPLLEERESRRENQSHKGVY